MNRPEGLNQGADFIDQGRLRSALKAHLHEYGHPNSLGMRALAAYNLGALYWGEIGDGIEARCLFLEAIELCHGVETHTTQGGDTEVPKELMKQIEANAAENLMILSLSFAECARWAEHLRRLAPNEAVLSYGYSQICAGHAKGYPWWVIMDGLADLYHDRKGSYISGRHASAACILHLIISHRDSLRVPRSGWRIAVGKLGSLLVLQHVQCDRLMKHAFGKTDGDESAFICQAAIGQTEEYLKHYPADRRLRRGLGNLRRAIALDDQLRAQGKSVELPGDRREARVGRPMSIAIYLLAVGLGGVVGASWWHDVATLPWNVVLGAAVGLFVVDVLDRARRQVFREGSSAIPVHAHETLEVGDKAAAGSSFSSDTSAPGGARIDLAWQKSARLVHAIHKTGLQACRFRLVQLDVTQEWQELPITLPPGTVVLMFQPEVAMPAEKVHAAGLALRCIVGLTFPYAVTTTTSLNLQILPMKAEYLFGDGVPIGLYRVFREPDWVGPLQFRGTEADGVWRVYITLASVHEDGSVSDDAVTRQVRVLPYALSAFEPLTSLPVVFGKSEGESHAAGTCQ